MDTIYLLPGWGTDRRVFQWLTFESPYVQCLEWQRPEKGDTMASYAKRLADIIRCDDDEVVLVGLSMGGLLAIELSKHLNTKKVILISSIKSKRERPLFMKFLSWVPLHWLLPQVSFTWFHYLMKPAFKGNKVAYEMFKDMLLKFDRRCLKWAVNQIIMWKQEDEIPNLTHIHGDIDRLFPLKNIEDPVIVIEGGSHVMVGGLGKKIGDIIDELLRGKQEIVNNN